MCLLLLLQKILSLFCESNSLNQARSSSEALNIRPQIEALMPLHETLFICAQPDRLLRFTSSRNCIKFSFYFCSKQQLAKNYPNPASAVVLEDMVLVSRRLEDLKKGLGLGLDRMVLILVLVLILKSCNFQDLQVQLFLL